MRVKMLATKISIIDGDTTKKQHKKPNYFGTGEGGKKKKIKEM